jgi:hypothetical protein
MILTTLTGRSTLVKPEREEAVGVKLPGMNRRRSPVSSGYEIK